MTKGRLEAFSDGVVAILITIMVLELKAPAGSTWGTAFTPTTTKSLLTYVLSFVSIAIYWNNHHHLLHAASRINGAVLWANTHLLFWLSLIPYTTGWMEEQNFEPLPTAAYGAVLFLCAIAFTVLKITLIRQDGPNSKLAKAMGDDLKGKISLALYTSAIPLAFVRPVFSVAIYVIVGLIWFIPDRRVERVLGE
jgi:uncharacterized membrane protein